MIEEKSRISVHKGSKEEALVLKILLESFSIQVFEDSSLMSVFNPWGVLIGDVNAVKLKVADVDYKRAKAIIENYNSGKYNLLISVSN